MTLTVRVKVTSEGGAGTGKGMGTGLGLFLAGELFHCYVREFMWPDTNTWYIDHAIV